jgi:hypothetical protein
VSHQEEEEGEREHQAAAPANVKEQLSKRKGRGTSSKKSTTSSNRISNWAKSILRSGGSSYTTDGLQSRMFM